MIAAHKTVVAGIGYLTHQDRDMNTCMNAARSPILIIESNRGVRWPVANAAREYSGDVRNGRI